MFKHSKEQVPEFKKSLNSPSLLVIKRREASWLIAALLIICLLSFLAGYFMGQRKAAATLIHQANEEAFIDQVEADAYVNSQPEFKEEKKEEKVESDEPSTVKKDVSKKSPDELAQKVSPKIKYFAPLATYDRYLFADGLAEQAGKLGVELRIKKSYRKLKNGKRKKTHQILTKLYDFQEALKQDLALLKQLPEFKEARFVIRTITKD